MGIGRSAFYDTPDARARDLSIVVEMKTICDFDLECLLAMRCSICCVAPLRRGKS